MATSQITLYYTDLAPNLNYLIEDIDAYLATKVNSDTYKVRYIEPKLQQTIVLKGSQSILSTGLTYNYAKVVTRDDDKISTQYYFVQSLQWGSRKTVVVNLLLDTLNTLSSDYITTHCDDRTAIIREHQDRWKKVNGKFIAKVDPYDEGLQGLAKEEQSISQVLNDKHMYWVQISANATSPNVTDTHPYRSLICYEESKEYDSAGSNTKTYNIPSGPYIHSFLEGTITYKVNAVSVDMSYTIGQSTIAKDGLVGTLRLIKVSPSEVLRVYCTGDTFPYTYLTSVKELYYINCQMSNVRRDYKEAYSVETFENLTNLDRVPFLSYTNVNAGKYTAHVVKGINDLDRTQSYLMQINPIPYFKITLQGEFIEGYDMIMLKNSDAENKIVGDSEHSVDYTLETMYLLQSTLSLNDNDDYLNESKLWHHSITDSTISYQGNVLLAIDWSRSSKDMIVNQFLTLDDSNVGLMKIRTSLTNYKTYSPYEMTAFVDNKYNIPLFTNQWTEYVRNGYNYDAAERSRQKALQGWSIAVSAVSAAVGVGSTVLGAGKAIGNAISLGKSTFQNAINQSFLEKINNVGSHRKTLLGDAKAERALDLDTGIEYAYTGRLYDPSIGGISDFSVVASNIESEIKSARKAAFKSAFDSLSRDKLGTMVTTQALGSMNNIITASSAILSANTAYQYNITTKSQSKTAIAGNTTSYKLAIDNKITYEEWQPRTEVLKNLAKTFYLTGYSHPVIEKPNISSRTYFNYLQCSPHWDIAALNNTNPLWLADMTDRLNEGITVFHHTNNSWDLSQTKANWETSLMN